MGRKKQEPGQTLTYINTGFYPEELRIIQRTMAALGMSRGAAVRLLIRAGAEHADEHTRRQLAADPDPFTAEGDTAP